MIVVSDATPINHLLRAGIIRILPEMMGKVVIPEAVHSELTAESTPKVVMDFMNDRPIWLTVMRPGFVFDQDLDLLDQGEREAIMLAEELDADFLLIDEKKGRNVALRRNLPLIGTLGLLEKAAIKGLIELESGLVDLKATGFYLSSILENRLIQRSRDRGQRQSRD